MIVYLIMMSADWLQGPYVYALYKFYNYGIADIGMLFIVGFGSSMVFGTVVGSAADKYGRKKLCLVFGLLYSLSCLTKHIKHFQVLMIGRLLGGISTSILFSSFESWMVHVRLRTKTHKAAAANHRQRGKASARSCFSLSLSLLLCFPPLLGAPRSQVSRRVARFDFLLVHDGQRHRGHRIRRCRVSRARAMGSSCSIRCEFDLSRDRFSIRRCDLEGKHR